jgi:hypothetical protein
MTVALCIEDKKDTKSAVHEHLSNKSVHIHFVSINWDNDIGRKLIESLQIR